MEKSFTHHDIEYIVKTAKSGELFEVGIFTSDDRRPFHLQIEVETFGDILIQSGEDANHGIQRLVDFTIADFCRAVDEGILKL